MIYLNGWLNLFNFKGLASRKELISFFVINVIIAKVLQNYIGYISFTSVRFVLIGYMCHLSLFVRRLHDTGRSGQYIFLVFIPFGIFYLLYLLLKPSVTKDNKYKVNDKKSEVMA